MMTRPAFSRRRFMQLGAAAGMITTGAFAAAGGPVSAAPLVTRYPLRLPALETPGALRAAPGSADIGSATVGALLYNGKLPGPIYQVRSGDSVSVAFTNGLTQDTTVHWHGLIVPTAADGQPQDPVRPGNQYTYAFPVRQRAGMSWYHPHPHVLTAPQVAYGLAGGFLIRDAEEDALGLPGGGYEIPLVLRDANIDTAGNLSYNGKASGFLGKILLVNGTRDPYLNALPAIYRFRVLGGSNSRLFRLALSTGARFTLIGNDGGLLPSVVTPTEIEISPGERVDILVDLRGSRGQTVLLRDLNSGWTLLEMRVANTTPVTGTLPSGALSTVTPLGTPTRTRTFSFDGMTRINGKVFDPNRIDLRVKAGEVEDWVFTTNGNAPHPVHVHGVHFQVQSRTGGRNTLYPWEAGWKDTVLLNDGETVRIRLRFDLTGRYVIHCHKLEHEDAGMMATFVVE